MMGRESNNSRYSVIGIKDEGTVAMAEPNKMYYAYSLYEAFRWRRLLLNFGFKTVMLFKEYNYTVALPSGGLHVEECEADSVKGRPINIEEISKSEHKLLLFVKHDPSYEDAEPIKKLINYDGVLDYAYTSELLRQLERQPNVLGFESDDRITITEVAVLRNEQAEESDAEMVDVYKYLRELAETPKRQV